MLRKIYNIIIAALEQEGDAVFLIKISRFCGFLPVPPPTPFFIPFLPERYVIVVPPLAGGTKSRLCDFEEGEKYLAKFSWVYKEEYICYYIFTYYYNFVLRWRVFIIMQEIGVIKIRNKTCGFTVIPFLFKGCDDDIIDFSEHFQLLLILGFFINFLTEKFCKHKIVTSGGLI